MQARTVQAAQREGRVVVYSVLSNKAAAPLVQGFKALYPGIEVEYDGEGGSTETDARFRAEVAAGQASADVVWSSAMDLQMKLVADGYAMHHASPEAAMLPPWAVYQDLAWGTTFEPVVFIYNKARVSAADVPQDRAAFARLLDAEPDKYRGKVTAFDIEKSGVGFMFAVQDRALATHPDQLLHAFGRAHLQPSAGTGNMLTKVASGEYLLGYNIMGGYALSRSGKDLPGLGVVIPKDYTVVLSRVMFISKHARNPNAARLWADYVLSARGQQVIGTAMELYALREGVDAPYTAATLAPLLGAGARPMKLDLTLLDDLQPARHRAFVAAWKAAVRPVTAR
ncbi:MAG: ABC transporter substrate-binding protein [Rubrivivax sp.]